MKTKIIIFILIIIVNTFVFSDDFAQQYSQIREIIYELFEYDHIHSIGMNASSTYAVVSIYFNAGLSGLKENFNSKIEYDLLPNILEFITFENFSIRLLYPFSIILTNRHNYDFYELQNIRQNINIRGINIENIFQNSIYGFYEDNNFGDFAHRSNENIFNNLNLFLDKIIEYFDVGNIITY